MSKKYDVAILGWWHNSNYGSIMTYYALNKAILDQGYSTLLVHEALGYPARHKLAADASAIGFAQRQGFEYTEQENYAELEKLNNVADTFVVGSDQLWNPYIGRINDDLFLNFTAPEAKRIAYGTSIGNFNQDTFQSDHFGSDFEQVQKQNLERFDWMSMREDDGIVYMDRKFGFDIPQVVDPVFLIDPKNYHDLANQAKRQVEEPYMLAFILDPNEDKKRSVQAVADKLGLEKIVIYTDANHKQLEHAKKVFHEPHFIFDDEIRSENWLNAYQNAEYVVTDSFHGSCFAYIFQKPFSVFFNKIRGTNRFASLMRLFKLDDTRRIYEENTVEDIQNNPNVSMEINYTAGNANLALERKKSSIWFENALKAPKADNKILDGATMIENLKPVAPHEAIHLKRLLLTNEFVFYRRNMSGDPIRQNVKLNQDGTISGTSPANESFWKLEDNKLTFFGAKNQPTTVWHGLRSSYRANEFLIDGIFQLDGRTHHILETVSSAIKRDNSNPDFRKMKILLAHLHEYGIKHVVLSPGGRDVVLMRGFENHQDKFKIHHVVDERSAGYYALGIANKLNEPVAVMVTSGTAVNNLSPAITEAFYMDLPIVAITADRYPEFHGIGEDQTVEEVGIFEPMIKKSVSIPTGGDPRNEWFAGRLIADTLNAVTHGGTGPVHINMSFDILPNMSPIRASYTLPSVRHIRHITRQNGLNEWQEYVDVLKRSSRILINYGQNFTPTKEQQKNIDLFASRYNAVILTDWLSNLNGDKVVKTYNAIPLMSQTEFNQELVPDVLITLGGKQTLTHPITFKYRGAPKEMRHWHVSPNGQSRDLYFHLSSILETDLDWFFKYFAAQAEGLSNSNEYLNKWHQQDKKYPVHKFEHYNYQYVTQQLLENMPDNSLFHIGVGATTNLVHQVNTVPDKPLDVYINMGTNGIDGSASSFMGQVAVDESSRLKFMQIGDVSFFYDMNSLWNKDLKGNIRIMMVNNSGSGLLRHYGSKGTYAPHSAIAKGWVTDLGFTYITCGDKNSFDEAMKRFVSDEDAPMFFEVFI